MGTWDNTAYLKESSLEKITSALDALFAAEGRRRVEKPPSRRAGTEEPMQYEGGAKNPLWAVALIPGVDGWTAVKTAPLELLCERPGGKSRLAALAKALGAPAFQLNLYDSESLVLVEAAPDGKSMVSGFVGHADDDPTLYQGETIAETEAQFRLLQVPAELSAAMASDDPIAAAFTAHSRLVFGEAWDGDEASSVDNRVQVNVLIPHEDFGDGTALYYRYSS